jgi:hypothetical protein
LLETVNRIVVGRHHWRCNIWTRSAALARIGRPPSSVARGVVPPSTSCGPLPPALPARRPHYVIPGSHWNDPAYWQMPRSPNPWSGGWPLPRTPWPGESETRAAGTGLISSGPFPCPPPAPWSR